MAERLESELQLNAYASVSSFEEFMAAYERTYKANSTEYAMRERLFNESLAAVERQNSIPASERRWTAGISWMSDYTSEEMHGLYGFGGFVRRAANSSFLQREGEIRTGVTGRAQEEELAALPNAFDWTSLWTAREENTHNQGCGNCWAMSTTSMLEAHNELYNNFTRHFSYEEITQCADNPWHCGGTGGCGGSIPELALIYLAGNGLGSSGHEMAPCPANPTSVGDLDEPPPHEPAVGVRLVPADSPARKFGMIGWERLPENRVDNLKRALVARGPVTAALSTDWSGYRSGIFDGCDRDAVVRHSMLLLGYGKDTSIMPNEGGTGYWLIQNSWGPGWGEGGKMRVLRLDDEDEEKLCGIDRDTRVGNGCKDGPGEAKVCGNCGILYHTAVVYFEPKEETLKQRLVRYLGRRVLEQL